MIDKIVFKAPGSVRPFHTLTLINSMWVNGSINYSHSPQTFTVESILHLAEIPMISVQGMRD